MQQYERQSAEAGEYRRPVLPPEAYELAERSHLGKPTAYYLHTKARRSRWTFFLPPAIFFLIGLFFELLAVLQGNIFTLIMATLVLVPPFSWAVYMTGRMAFSELRMLSAHAYFCQQGLIYRDYTQQAVLRWEEIERCDILYRHPAKTCQVLLGNGTKLTLANSVGGNLCSQIRRRLLRARKKHQHPEIFHTTND